MKIGRESQIVDCRAAMGMSVGGGLAEKGTFSEAEETGVIVLSMSPTARHVTKPVCEITYGLREARIPVSVLVLEAGMGLPYDAPGGVKTQTCGITDKEIAQMNRHKLAVIHSGNIPSHFIYKVRVFLRHAEVPAIVVCQAPITLDRFAEVGIRTRGFEGEFETKGMVVDVVSGVVRGETCTAPKLEELIKKTKYWLSVYSSQPYTSD